MKDSTGSPGEDSAREKNNNSAKPKSRRKKRRRVRNVISSDGIRGKMIGEPKGPLTWWGPFDPGRAIGRAVLLIVFFCLAIIIIYAVDIMEDAGRTTRHTADQPITYSTVLDIGPHLRVPVKNAVAVLIILQACLSPIVLGFFYHRPWGIMYLKLALMPVSFIIAGLAFWMVRGVLFWGEERMLWHDAFGMLSFFGLVARAVFFILLFTGFSIPMFLYWRAKHVKYAYGYVQYDEVEGDLFKTTSRFGLSIAQLGGALLLMGLIMAQLGEPVIGNYVKNESTAIPHIIILAAAAALVGLTIMFGFRLYAFIPGIVVVLCCLAWVEYLWLYKIIPPIAGDYYHGRNVRIDYGVVNVGCIIAVPGFLFLSAGLGFWKKSNKARLILQALVLLMIPFFFAWMVPGVYREVRELKGFPFNVEASDIVGILVPLFGLLIPAYICFELFRFFRTDKAKAWCGVGEYTPPWKYQVEAVMQRENEKSVDKG